jgi:hypothetical protein
MEVEVEAGKKEEEEVEEGVCSAEAREREELTS